MTNKIDDMLEKLQGCYDKIPPKQLITEIKRFIEYENMNEEEIDIFYNCIVDNHKSGNYFPTKGQIVEYWKKHGSRREYRSGIDTNQKALEDGAKMSIQEIYDHLWYCRDKKDQNSCDFAFIACWDNLCYKYSIFKEKYNERFAVEKCEEIKKDMLHGMQIDIYDYSEFTNIEMPDLDKERKNKVVQSEEIINELF